MFSSFVFSLKNAFRKKGVAFLAILGTALGCSLLVIMLATTQGMNQMLENTFKRISNKIVISGQGSFLGISLHEGGSLISQGSVDKIAKIEHIESVSSRVTAIIPRETFKVMDPFSALVGVDLKEDRESDGVTNYITNGRVFSEKNEVVIGEMLVESAKLADNEVELNEEIEMLVYPERENESFSQEKPKKIKLKIVGFFETGDIVEDAFVYGSINLTRKISNIPSGQWSSVVVRTDSVDYVDSTAKEIEKELDDESIQVVVSKNLLAEFTESLGIFNNFRFAISLVSGIAGGMSILIVMLVSVINRRREFAILKAVGWNEGNIILSILVESLVLGMIGSLSGILIGWGGTLIMAYYIEIISEIAYINWNVFLYIMFFGVFIGVIGGVYPAWRASRVAPMEILRNE
jgi:putative ABC transport system permease protein